MYRQLFNKCLFDGLDHFALLVLPNLIFTGCLVGIGFAGKFFLIPILILVMSFHYLGVNGISYGIVRDSGSWFENYVRAIKKFGHFAVFSILILLAFFAGFFVAPWYFSMGNIAWYVVGFFVIYLAVTLCVALMYYYPLCLAFENDSPFTTLKKSFSFMTDNLLFTGYCLLKNLCDLAISILTLFLIPGIAGMAITQNTAVYFLILKYEWMSEKKVGKHDVPADELLSSVMEKYEDKSLKSILFPWK